MALNYPGPYGMEFTYVVAGLQHTMEFNVSPTVDPDPGENPNLIDLLLTDGGTETLTNVAAAWVVLMQPLYSTTAEFLTVTLWKYTPFSFERQWITELALGDAGTNPNPYTPAGQITYSFRSSNGGIMKVVLLESVVEGNNQTPVSALTGAGAAVATYVVNNDSPFLARDDGRPIAGLLFSRGQNERVFRKRFR